MNPPLLRIQELYSTRFDIKPIGDPQTLLSMLINKQIDTAALPEHCASVAEANGAKVSLRAQDAWPGMPGMVFLRILGGLLRASELSINT